MTDTIKKTALTLAGLAALGFGGAQLANATSGSTPAPVTQSADGGDHDGDGDGGNDASEAVTGAAAEQAKAAALAEVPGKVTRLQAETADDQGEHGDAADKPEAGDTPDAADKPEAGDKADPAYESQIAYDVEVTAADGTITDVALDKSFKVLGTEQEGKEGAGE